MMRINQAGIDLIKSFEGRRLVAYQDQGGVWTVGYGHTGPEVVKGLSISPDEAEELLSKDIATKAEPIQDYISEQINDNQFSAICSLCFNIGLTAVKHSTLLRKINSGEDVTDEWLKWCHVNGVPNDGLLRRRKAELELYNTLG